LCALTDVWFRLFLNFIILGTDAVGRVHTRATLPRQASRAGRIIKFVSGVFCFSPVRMPVEPAAADCRRRSWQDLLFPAATHKYAPIPHVEHPYRCRGVTHGS